MAHNVESVGQTVQLKTEPGAIHGLLCTNAGTSGTITIYDSVDGDTGDKAVIDTLSLTAGTDYLMTDAGARCEQGIYIVIGGTGSPAVTVLFS